MPRIVCEDFEETVSDADWMSRTYQVKHYVYRKVYSDGSANWVATSDEREWANRGEFQ